MPYQKSPTKLPYALSKEPYKTALCQSPVCICICPVLYVYVYVYVTSHPFRNARDLVV